MGIRRKTKNKDALLQRAHLGNIDNPDDILNLAREHGIKTKPLDIEALLRKLDIDIIFSNDLDKEISGELIKNQDGKWVCTVNNKHHHTRQRLTMAHELGHYILHRNDAEKFIDYSYFRRTETYSQREFEANFFAGSILMPEDDIKYFVKNISDKIDDIAACFDVSPLAVEVRLKQIGLK